MLLFVPFVDVFACEMSDDVAGESAAAGDHVDASIDGLAFVADFGIEQVEESHQEAEHFFSLLPS